MTPKQKIQFNQMRAALKRIAKEYQTPAQLRKNSMKGFDLEADEAVDMAYENIQIEATNAVAGVKAIL